MEIPLRIVTRQRKCFRVELSMSALGSRSQFPLLELVLWETEGAVSGPRGWGLPVTPLCSLPEVKGAEGPASQTKQPRNLLRLFFLAHWGGWLRAEADEQKHFFQACRYLFLAQSA